MRISINLCDDLLAFVNQKATEKNQTLTSVIEDALRLLMSENQQVNQSTRRIGLPTFKGDGLKPGVDLANTAEWIDRMEV